MTDDAGRAPAASPVPEESNVETRVEDFTQDADLSIVVTLLTERRDEILSRWIDAASDQPFHQARSERAVADHIPPLFDGLVALLSRDSSRERNPGVPLEDPAILAAAQEHARMRFGQGFTPPDIATEFRLLRQEIGRAMRRYVSDHAATRNVIAAELLVHDSLDGAVFLALSALNEHEVARRRVEDLLRESEERFRLLVETVEEYAICTLTPDGRVASWNAGAQRFFGYSLVEIMGQPYERLFTEEDAAAGEPARLLGAAVAEGRVSGEGRRRRADGSRFTADAALTALRDGDGALMGFAVVMHDVTGRQRLEAEREAVERERDAFFVTLGHDLKSPLAHAVAVAQLLRLQTEKGRADPAELPGRLRAIEAALHRAALRVDELRDLAQREAHDVSTLRREGLDLVALLDDALAGYRFASDRHTFELETDLSTLTGRWDRDRIERVLDNLLSNAVKFSPAGGTIRMTLSEVAVDGARWAVIEVADEGRGVPDGETGTIFDRFRRGSNAGDVTGSGLGLWSVARIVEQHGGTVSVASRPGSGSTFTIRIPATASPR